MALRGKKQSPFNHGLARETVFLGIEKCSLMCKNDDWFILLAAAQAVISEKDLS
jgi:hypothetical protein